MRLDRTRWTLRVWSTRRAPLPLALFLGASSCGPGAAEPGFERLEEDGIVAFHAEPAALRRIALEPGESEGRFELPEIDVSRPFDRVALRWEVLEAGGDTRVEILANGAPGGWRAVAVDFAEFVAESGVTLYSGHVDLPGPGFAGRLRARLHLTRDPDAMSPEPRALTLEAFVLAEVEEIGEPAGGEGASLVPAPSIVSRSAWGARAPRCNGAMHDPYRMTFHHTVTPNGETGNAAKSRMRQMQAFHQDGRGWCDIGYHLVVDAAGQIYRGRTTEARSASHVGGQNGGNIGVSLLGTYDAMTPPAAVLDGLTTALAWLADAWGIAADGAHVRGHREWPGQSTGCPGATVIERKGTILQSIAQKLGGSTTPPPPPAGTVIVDNRSAGFSASPNWWVSTSQPDRYGVDYEVRETDGVSDPATWNAPLEARHYEVFVWYSQGSNRASAAPFFVYHRDGTAQRTVDQRVNGGRWVSLGTYPFVAGDLPRVGLSCWTASGSYVAADAVKLEPRS